jgi:hypothetical protein
MGMKLPVTAAVSVTGKTNKLKNAILARELSIRFITRFEDSFVLVERSRTRAVGPVIHFMVILLLKVSNDMGEVRRPKWPASKTAVE